MFNKDFYPTPPATIAAMLEGLNLHGKMVWEPEGGKGDLVKAMQERGARVVASESDSFLQKILQTICPLLGTDMLNITSEQISHVDYIVMNPPFSDGVNHILHAYRIAPAGCKLIALCNLETLDNAYSKSREELKTLVETYGSYQDIGDCFSSAERSTGVKVALIRMDKPGDTSTEFDGFFMEEEHEAQANGLITYNVVRDLVNRYVESIKIFDQQLETAARLNEIQADYFDAGVTDLSISVTRLGVPVERNKFKKEMQRQGWAWIFDKLNMQKHSTRGLREDINKFVEKQEHVPFTMRNIYHMIEIVIGTAGSRMDKALMEVFDRVTDHSHDNRMNLEGWKTNSHYLLTRRFIIPRMAPIDKWNTDGRLSNCYGGYFDLMEDVMKALCYVGGARYEDQETLAKACKREDVVYGEWFTWSFFRVKAFKKGTMHFEFIDEKLWSNFNQRIAKLKGYPLPEQRSQTAYQQRQNGRRPERRPITVMETIKI